MGTRLALVDSKSIRLFPLCGRLIYICPRIISPRPPPEESGCSHVFSGAERDASRKYRHASSSRVLIYVLGIMYVSLIYSDCSLFAPRDCMQLSSAFDEPSSISIDTETLSGDPILA